MRTRHPILLALLLPGFLAVTSIGMAQDEKPKPEPSAARPDDVKSESAIIAALYDAISGPKGERDWDRLRSLFAPGARLIPVVPAHDGRPVEARVLTVDEFIARAKPAFEEDGFFESEVARRTERFGNIAHVFSTYESRRGKEDKPFARGINSIQLLKGDGRWFVVTIFWDSERPDTPIPGEYLSTPESK